MDKLKLLYQQRIGKARGYSQFEDGNERNQRDDYVRGDRVTQPGFLPTRRRHPPVWHKDAKVEQQNVARNRFYEHWQVVHNVSMVNNLERTLRTAVDDAKHSPAETILSTLAGFAPIPGAETASGWLGGAIDGYLAELYDGALADKAQALLTQARMDGNEEGFTTAAIKLLRSELLVGLKSDFEKILGNITKLSAARKAWTRNPTGWTKTQDKRKHKVELHLEMSWYSAKVRIYIVQLERRASLMREVLDSIDSSLLKILASMRVDFEHIPVSDSPIKKGGYQRL